MKIKEVTKYLNIVILIEQGLL